MKVYWFNKYCCVPECFNSSTEGDGCYKEYFDLPAEPQARNRWLSAILTVDGDNLKICEDHFTDADVFRDKSNRKKLRLNSVPSVKLPKNICRNCLGSTKSLDSLTERDDKICKCEPTPTDIQTTLKSTNKRTRIKWTIEEKLTLFKGIKHHGDLKVDNNNSFRINWNSVVNYCRANGCFGNEKELRTVWQYLRMNAQKVYKNEIFGSKLERKVSRFLYGKPRKKIRTLSLPKNGNISTDEEMIEEEEEGACATNGNGERMEAEESDNEYYSISDVEKIFNINIRPKPLEVISLLSSEGEN